MPYNRPAAIFWPQAAERIRLQLQFLRGSLSFPALETLACEALRCQRLQPPTQIPPFLQAWSPVQQPALPFIPAFPQPAGVCLQTTEEIPGLSAFQA